ncbi:MAG: hypothetical protein K0V04_29205 [Deltaproteobacteria bacterium]|nr:hypothetical protein [Deltaproteobacteria bacterium]
MLGAVVVTVGGWMTLAADLRWTAPPACPTAAMVQERVVGLVGQDSIANDVTAVAIVRREGDGWSLQLTLRDGDRASQRSMQSGDCETLADAVALVVATFVEPVATTRIVEERTSVPPDVVASSPVVDRSPPPSPADRVDAGVVVPPSADPSATPRARPDTWWGMRVGGAAGRALLSDLDVGPQLTVSWQRGLLRLAAQGLFLAPRRQRVPERQGLQLRQWAIVAGLRAGVALPLTRRLEMPLSLGVEAGPVIARGEGVVRPRTAVSPWAAAVGAAQLVWRPVPRWGLWAGAAVVVGVFLPRFTVDAAGPLVAGPGGFRANLGVEWRWGLASP